jgi:hypothetical protein
MKNHLRSLQFLATRLVICFALSSAAFAVRATDRTQMGHNINVEPGEEISEATCFGCTIRIRGHVLGDATAFGGSIIVEDQGKVNGDATAFGGDIRLDKQVSVAGDVAVFGGHLRRDPAATIGGDATNFAGAGWMLLIFLLPIVVLGAFIAFVVWLIRRIMRPSVPATA